MPIKAGWLVHGQVGVMKVIGTSTVEDIFNASAWLVAEYDQCPQETVFSLVDISEQEQPLPIKAFRDTPKSHKNQWAILVGETNALNRFIGTATLNMLGIHLKIVENMDEAKIVIQRIDPNLQSVIASSTISYEVSFENGAQQDLSTKQT